MVEAPSSEELVVKAPAKVNLVLRVLDRRPDGYHNLWSIMQTVGLEDELRVQLRRDSNDLTLQCDDPTLPTDARNLVHRAVTRVLDVSGRRVGVDVRLTKRIPQGGGLGGGSSDAAATILALNRMMGLAWSVAEMAEVGEPLGSDVPFFFQTPTAIVRGRGGDVEPVRMSGHRWIVLVNPGFPVETRWAYERLSQIRAGVRPLSQNLLALTRHASVAWEDLVPMMENDFEDALRGTHPALGAIKQALLDSGAEAALLSGSGATVFGVFREEGAAVRSCDRLRQQNGYQAHVAPTASGTSVTSETHPRTPVGSGQSDHLSRLARG